MSVKGSWFPPGLENGKAFSSQGILPKILEKSGNFTQNTGKSEKFYWKNQGNLSASNSENPGNMVPYFKLKRTFKNTGKMQKYWKSQGNCQPEKVGTIKR